MYPLPQYSGLGVVDQVGSSKSFPEKAITTGLIPYQRQAFKTGMAGRSILPRQAQVKLTVDLIAVVLLCLA